MLGYNLRLDYEASLAMLRKIILAICIIGITYYSIQIYRLKDRISFESNSRADGITQPDKKMHLHFSMSSTDADLLSRCQQLFDSKDDSVSLNPDPADPKKAILSVDRIFTARQLQANLDLHLKVRAANCLTTDKDVFTFQDLK